MHRYASDSTLFFDIDFPTSLNLQRKTIETEVNALDPNRVLNTAPEDLITYFVDKNTVEVPTLDLDNWSVESTEGTQQVSDYGRTINVSVQRLAVRIPFEGEAQLFQARPSTHTTMFPRGIYDGNALTIYVSAHEGQNPDTVKAAIDRAVNDIQQYLSWLRSDAAYHNGQLRRIAERAVTERRQQVLSRQGLVSGLGIPVRERAGAGQTYVVPTVRKAITPSLPAASTTPYKPEPVLAMAEYEHILTTVQNMCLVMERSPSTFARIKEEALRDHFLVQLNGQYQSATGETFNATGKTDILIRVENKNIFIAECKFWKGPAGYTDTINQLLGYSSWRDTKTAIFIFNRNRDSSKVLHEMQRVTEHHPHYKRTPSWHHESGHRFVMHHPTDSNRELTMTVLVFDIPDGKTSDADTPRPIASKAQKPKKVS